MRLPFFKSGESESQITALQEQLEAALERAKQAEAEVATLRAKAADVEAKAAELDAKEQNFEKCVVNRLVTLGISNPKKQQVIEVSKEQTNSGVNYTRLAQMARAHGLHVEAS